MDCKVIIALNMVDLLEKKGFYVDENRLEKILGAKVIKISALKGTGVNYLINEINIYSKNKKQYIFDAKLEQEIQEIENNLKNSTNKRFVAVKMLENDMELEELIATERYDFIERNKEKCNLTMKRIYYGR